MLKRDERMGYNMREVTEYDNIKYPPYEPDPVKRAELAKKADEEMEAFIKKLQKKYNIDPNNPTAKP